MERSDQRRQSGQGSEQVVFMQNLGRHLELGAFSNPKMSKIYLVFDGSELRVTFRCIAAREKKRRLDMYAYMYESKCGLGICFSGRQLSLFCHIYETFVLM